MWQDAKRWARERIQSRKSVVCLCARSANYSLCLTQSKGIGHYQRGSCSQLLCTHSLFPHPFSSACVWTAQSCVQCLSALHSEPKWLTAGLEARSPTTTTTTADVPCLFLSLSQVPSSEMDLSVHTDLAYFQSWCTSSHIVRSPIGTWLPEVQWEPSGSSLNVTAQVLSSTYVIQENMDETPLRLHLRIILESFRPERNTDRQVSAVVRRQSCRQRVRLGLVESSTPSVWCDAYRWKPRPAQPGMKPPRHVNAEKEMSFTSSPPALRKHGSHTWTDRLATARFHLLMMRPYAADLFFFCFCFFYRAAMF